eukprot:CAMPEP_0178460078 /NCGR_PEP_ID=MMETSP0689_2-20121128/48486_1 /TAXON_ID=160604 /ORGANISM="Amphidinium massartii, Strain CS-259" /LENGTH=157 /DNA_ID=CAMNT_0020086627 /DNA_START=15 /DNA_END=484 /DNA_ORIENTATION=+
MVKPSSESRAHVFWTSFGQGPNTTTGLDKFCPFHPQLRSLSRISGTVMVMFTCLWRSVAEAGSARNSNETMRGCRKHLLMSTSSGSSAEEGSSSAAVSPGAALVDDDAEPMSTIGRELKERDNAAGALKKLCVAKIAHEVRAVTWLKCLCCNLLAAT